MFIVTDEQSWASCWVHLAPSEKWGGVVKGDLNVHSFSVAVVNDKLHVQSMTFIPPISTRKQPHLQLAPAPRIYVFESNCAYIVVCVDKLRAGTKTVKSLLCFTSPNFFQEASCFHLSLECKRLSTVGTGKECWKQTKNYPTSNTTLCPKTA